MRDDQVTSATALTLTLSLDHRAVDGATAAAFLTRLRGLIEQPLDIVLGSRPGNVFTVRYVLMRGIVRRGA